MVRPIVVLYSCLLGYFLTAFYTTLSMFWKPVLNPIFVRCVMFSLNVSIVEVSVRSFTGVDNIAFENQLYGTNIAVLPSLDVKGNFPV